MFSAVNTALSMGFGVVKVSDCRTLIDINSTAEVCGLLSETVNKTAQLFDLNLRPPTKTYY